MGQPYISAQKSKMLLNMYTTDFIIGIKRKLEKTRIFWYVFLLLNLIRQHEKPKRYINFSN